MPKDVLTLKDALLGGPGLDGYAYCADVYCIQCGQERTREVFKEYPNGIEYPLAQDSETVPQPIFYGESDQVEICGDCGELLYGPLGTERVDDDTEDSDNG